MKKIREENIIQKYYERQEVWARLGSRLSDALNTRSLAGDPGSHQKLLVWDLQDAKDFSVGERRSLHIYKMSIFEVPK